MEAVLEKRRARGTDEQIERLKARVAEEYASFRRALEEWSKLRDQWVTDRKQRLLQRWEETSYRSRMREIEHSLRTQRRRLQVMSKAYA
jgi:stearoyl-CoA desaturase (delta-9 desaturase)